MPDTLPVLRYVSALDRLFNEEEAPQPRELPPRPEPLPADVGLSISEPETVPLPTFSRTDRLVELLDRLFASEPDVAPAPSKVSQPAPPEPITAPPVPVAAEAPLAEMTGPALTPSPPPAPTFTIPPEPMTPAPAMTP